MGCSLILSLGRDVKYKRTHVCKSVNLLEYYSANTFGLTMLEMHTDAIYQVQFNLIIYRFKNITKYLIHFKRWRPQCAMKLKLYLFDRVF